MIKFVKKVVKKLLSYTKKAKIWWIITDKWDNFQGSYSTENIFNIVKKSTKNVKDGIFAYERDSVNFDTPVYQESVLFALRKIIADNGKNIKILDFGGALGSHYFCYSGHPEFHDVNFTWIVIEQEKFVEIGKNEFSDENLKFEFKIEDALDKYGKPDLILCSSVFMYIENYVESLEKLCKLGSKYLLIARNFVDYDLEDKIIAIQEVPKEIYEAKYPCYIFGKNFYDSIISTFHYQEIFHCLSAVDGNYIQYRDKKNIQQFCVEDKLFCL